MEEDVFHREVGPRDRILPSLLGLRGRFITNRHRQEGEGRSPLSSSSSRASVARRCLEEPGTMAAGFLIRARRRDARRKKEEFWQAPRRPGKKEPTRVRRVRCKNLITAHDGSARRPSKYSLPRRPVGGATRHLPLAGTATCSHL